MKRIRCSTCSGGPIVHDLPLTGTPSNPQSLCVLNKAPSSQSTKRRSPAKRQRSPKPRTAPSRTSRRLKGESIDPDDLVALPGTWIGSLAIATSKPGELRVVGWCSKAPGHVAQLLEVTPYPSRFNPHCPKPAIRLHVSLSEGNAPPQPVPTCAHLYVSLLTPRNSASVVSIRLRPGAERRGGRKKDGGGIWHSKSGAVVVGFR